MVGHGKSSTYRHRASLLPHCRHLINVIIYLSNDRSSGGWAIELPRPELNGVAFWRKTGKFVVDSR
ncbi:MAG: hypothetical protein ACTSUE_00900 [Promethearchaeota archaeon]